MDTRGLAQYAEGVFKATAGLMKMVPADKLNWRPSETNNWMTVGQLLEHLTESTGAPIQMFITGKFPAEISQGLPPAEKMPSAPSVAVAMEKLEADRKLTAKLLADLPEQDFRNRMVAAPWGGPPLPLWMQLLSMVEHQVNHKAALFAYLKLLGLPVHTGHLYGVM